MSELREPSYYIANVSYCREAISISVFQKLLCAASELELRTWLPPIYQDYNTLHSTALAWEWSDVGHEWGLLLYKPVSLISFK